MPGSLRQSATIFGLSVLTLGLGLAVQVGLAARFGAGRLMDVYLAAIALPTWLTESLYSATYYGMVPVLKGYAARNQRQALNATLATILGWTAGGGAIMVVLVWVSAPMLVEHLAPGFETEARRQTADLLRVMFIGNWFDALRAVLAAKFYADERPAWPQFVPILNHTCMLLALGWSVEGAGLMAIAVAWMLGSFCMVIPLVPYAIKSVEWRQAAFLPGAHDVGRQMLPAFLITLAAQAMILIDRWAASSLSDGSISFLGYGNKLFQVMLRTVPMSLGMVFFPKWSDLAARCDWLQLRRSLYQTVGLGLAGILPVALVVIVFRHLLVTVVFQRGAFDAAAAAGVSATLLWYGVAFVPASISYWLSLVFYGLRKPWHLVGIQLAGLGLTAALDVPLARYAGAPGIAAVAMLAAVLVCVLSVAGVGVILRKK